MPTKCLLLGHESSKPKKVREKAKLFFRAKTSFNKNPSNTVTEIRMMTNAYISESVPGPLKV